MLMKNKDLLHEAMCKNTKHYRHACHKHPGFCNNLNPFSVNEINLNLSELRSKFDKNDDVSSYDILLCEIFEIFDAYESHEYKQAREEVRDAIAVLERMDDMIVEKSKDVSSNDFE